MKVQGNWKTGKSRGINERTLGEEGIDLGTELDTLLRPISVRQVTGRYDE